MDKFLVNSAKAGGITADVCCFRQIFGVVLKTSEEEGIKCENFIKEIMHGNDKDINRAWRALGAVQIT